MKGVAVAAADPVPPSSTSLPGVVVDVTPPAVMPVSVSVPATSTPEPLPPVSVAVGVAPVSPSLPVTGGHELAIACLALGFVLVGASLRGPLARRKDGA